jgi:hypothetical protein
MFTDMHVSTTRPAHPTGWAAAAYTKVSFAIPDDWKAGRIWARRDCDFSAPGSGPTACRTGGCNGGLECDLSTGTGVPPASLAEFTLSGDGNQDWVSDLYLRRITKFADCPLVCSTTSRSSTAITCPLRSRTTLAAESPTAVRLTLPSPSHPRLSLTRRPQTIAVDLAPGCPAPLKGPFDSTGEFPLGCRSACEANLDGHQADSANCCSGSHDTAATCPASGVQYYSYFKRACPNAYAFAYDEASESALFTCDSGKKVSSSLVPG